MHCLASMSPHHLVELVHKCPLLGRNWISKTCAAAAAAAQNAQAKSHGVSTSASTAVAEVPSYDTNAKELSIPLHFEIRSRQRLWRSSLITQLERLGEMTGAAALTGSASGVH